MQKDNLDLLAEQLVSEINWDDDNIVQKPLGTLDPKTGVRRTNFVGNPALDQGLEDLDNKKYNQPINLVAANGENYTIIPNDQFREIGDKHRIHTSNGVSPQRGMNRGNRFTLQYGGRNDEKNRDMDDVLLNNVKNSHIISYSQFNDNPSFQGLLGQALLKFYQDKNIPEREQPLKINYKKLKDHMDLQNALNPRSDSYDPILTKKIRDAKSPEERTKIIKDYNKYKDKELYPASSSVKRADDINVDRIQKIYSYRNNLGNFKDKYASLNDIDKGLFDKIQKIITNPRQTGSTQMSPKDLMLLINNFKELSNDSKNAEEIRDNWNKLRWGELKYSEAILDLDSNLLTEDNPKPISYYQALLFDIITRSGTFFAPQEDSILGNSYLELFKDHWKDIPIELVKNSDTIEIYKCWSSLIEKYLLNYYTPKVVNWLRVNSPLGNQPVDIEDTINKIRSKFKSTFEFINQYDFKDRKEIIYELITGNELKHDTKAQKILKKDQDHQDILNRASDFYKSTNNLSFDVDYAESCKESKYDEMITKVLKELIG